MSVKKGSWVDLILGFGGSAVVAFWAWSNRPWEMREFTELAIAAISNSDKSMLKPWAFYAAMMLAAVLLAAGIRQVLLLQQDERQRS
jgi:hypothetical protein